LLTLVSDFFKSVNIWQSCKQQPDCLMHFLRLIAVCWPGIYTSAPESSTLTTRLPSHPVLGGWGLNIKLLFEIPKRHILARNHVSDVHLFCVDVEAGRPLGCRFFENRPPQKKIKIAKSTLAQRVREITHEQKRNPIFDLDKIRQDVW